MVRMWQETKEGLYKSFEFKDFKEAFDFMQKVAHLAEARQHHPRWTNDWNKVEIWLISHDAGNQITDKDHKMAKTISGLI